jgi:hypothetical protein
MVPMHFKNQKSGFSMNIPMEAIARVETGSLTLTLSRRERVSLLPRNDRPEGHPCEPS